MKHLWMALGIFFVLVGTVSGQSTPPNFPGKIAYIGPDFNVYVYAENANTALTDDATIQRHYQWPTWSNDGRLAYFCCDARFMLPPMRIETYISRNGLDSGKLIYAKEDEAFTYAYWSPSDCDEAAACRDLAVLLSRPNLPFKVEVIRDNSRTPSSKSVGSAAPFYFSWSPDGTRMVWQLNNRSLRLFDVDGDNEQSLVETPPGRMQAPQWSPVDDRVLVAALNADSETSDIILVDDGIATSLQEQVEGIIALSWSPDGRYIAYSVVSRQRGSVLVVVDSTSGEINSLARADVIPAFFWSPDSTQIAYVTPSIAGSASVSTTPAQNSTLRLQWNVLNIETEVVQSLSTFAPTNDMLYLLTYFDQFAQSHRLWSPDSRYIVYGESLENGEESVTILDTDSASGVTYSIASGSIGIWSYD